MEVAEILSKKEFHAITVIDNNKLIGIVTTTDLINYLLEQLLDFNFVDFLGIS